MENNQEVKIELTEEEKLEKIRKYRREYMARRRLEDPDFRKRQCESGKKSRQRPEAQEKERIRNRNRDRSAYFTERHKKQKEKFEEMVKQIEEMEKKLQNL